jgi:hypothetical protein
LGIYGQSIAGQTGRAHNVAKVAAALAAKRQQRRFLAPDRKIALICAALDLANLARRKPRMFPQFAAE